MPASTQLLPGERDPAGVQARWQYKQVAYLEDIVNDGLRVSLYTGDEQDVTACLSVIGTGDHLFYRGRKFQIWRADYTEGEAHRHQDRYVTIGSLPVHHTGKDRTPTLHPDMLFWGGEVSVGLLMPDTTRVGEVQNLGRVAALTLSTLEGHLPVWELPA